MSAEPNLEGIHVYHELALYIDGQWVKGSEGASAEVFNPATGLVIGHVPHASVADLDRALDAAQRGFDLWKKVPPNDRIKILRKAANLMRERAEVVARLMTQEQGKPLAEATQEMLFAPEHIDWCAEESRRIYGRLVPARAHHLRQIVMREPVGPVAGFSPWNFPVSQMIRKIAGSLSAGCSIIIKAPEETPASCMEAVRCFHDAGLPPGVLNLVFGVPAQISEHLIPHPVIRKVSFTGSVPVGKHLAALAARSMKRNTMELGGHAPVILFGDTDPEWAAEMLMPVKFRNAGQVCISPTRFYVHESIHDRFVARFAGLCRTWRVGDGMDTATQMGPLAAGRRVNVMSDLVDDAVSHGAKVMAGGRGGERGGYFYSPTLITEVADKARIMSEEPFGPVVPVIRFGSFEEAVRNANALPFGLSAYAFTRSLETAHAIAAAIETGMVSINGAPITAPETPFGGVKDSGYGSEGGIEGMDSYLTVKLISESSISGRVSDLVAARA